MARKAARTRKPVRRSKPAPLKLTQAQITTRDYQHSSTDDINKRIRVLTFESDNRETEINQLQRKLTDLRGELRWRQTDITALDILVESRR